MRFALYSVGRDMSTLVLRGRCGMDSPPDSRKKILCTARSGVVFALFLLAGSFGYMASYLWRAEQWRSSSTFGESSVSGGAACCCAADGKYASDLLPCQLACWE